MNGGHKRLATLLLFARRSAFFGNVRSVTSARCQRRGDSPKFERPSQRGKQNGGTRRCYARWETASFAPCGRFESCLGTTRAGQKWAEKCAHQATKRGEFGRRVWLKNVCYYQVHSETRAEWQAKYRCFGSGNAHLVPVHCLNRQRHRCAT